MPTTTDVKMSDGSTVSFNEKDKVKKLSSFSEDGSSLIVKFAFRNGTLKTCEIPAGSPVVLEAALHGFDQKFGDSFAGISDVEDCIATFDKLAESIGKGQWTRTRVGDGMAGTSELARALVKVTGAPIDAVKTQLAALSKEQKAALRTQPKVLAAIAELKAAKPAKSGGVDADGVLAMFGGGADGDEQTAE